MDDTGFIQTKWSMLNQNSAEDFKVTVFEARKPKQKNKTNLKIENEKEGSNVDAKDDIKERKLYMRRARYDIMQFGMSGFDGKKKEEINAEMLIKLGAKPPKRKNRNYKEILEEKKKALKTAAAHKDLQQAGKNCMGVSTAKGKSFGKRKQEKGGLLGHYGVVKPKLNEKKRKF